MAIADGGPARAALAMLDVDVGDLWVDYVGLGGALSLSQLVDFFSGRCVMSNSDYDRLAQAINELFMERDEDHPLPYAEDMNPTEDP
jgi:hypothetical protein